MSDKVEVMVDGKPAEVKAEVSLRMPDGRVLTLEEARKEFAKEEVGNGTVCESD